MPDAQTRNAQVSSAELLESEIVCGCANLSRGELRRFLASDRTADFDQLLQKTGAGTTCTACLLDLEYHFASLMPTVAVEKAASLVGRTGTCHTGLKSRLYGLLDRLSPAIPVTKREWMPVIFGEGLDEWFWEANHSLLYQKTAAPTIRVGLRIRDSEGNETYHATHDLPEGEAIRVHLSQHLKGTPARSGPSGLGIGSVEISRRALRPGRWGTTRPQVEIATPVASCAVHSQGPNGQREQWFTSLFRPGQERVFFSVVNVRPRPLRVQAAYLLDQDGEGVCDLAHEEIEVPPLGARLCEVALPAERARAASGFPLYLRWRCNGPRKIHLFCADPALSRFSIDHL